MFPTKRRAEANPPRFLVDPVYRAEVLAEVAADAAREAVEEGQGAVLAAEGRDR
jgi:hypothetical protein